VGVSPTTWSRLCYGKEDEEERHGEGVREVPREPGQKGEARVRPGAPGWAVRGGVGGLPSPLRIKNPKEKPKMVMGKMGETYRCLVCGQEVKVSKGGVGVLVCCQRNMREL